MKRTILLIAILVFSVSALLALSLQTGQKSKEAAVQPSRAETTLALTAPRIASGSGILTSDVVINTRGNKVTAVQLELSYNPKKLGYFSAATGKFFPKGTELLNKIDTENGKITYALGAGLGQKGIMGQGIVATLTFSRLVSTGTAEIKFDPKSLVTEEGNAQSVLQRATGTKFNLSLGM